MKKQILFVDDERHVLDALQRMLRSQRDLWEMTYVDRPEEAWEKLLECAYDAVVTDIKMPDMSGLELLERIQQTEQTKDLPVVVLTGLADHGLKQQALEMGATDLLNKPVDAGQLVARLENVLRVKSQQDDLKASNNLLRHKVHQQTIELAQSRLNVVSRLAKAAEQRDEETGNHVVRVGCYSQAIGAALGLEQAFLEVLLLAAPLHDIGKIGIPDSILRKPGLLTDEERATMQQHCVIGEKILCGRSEAMVPLLDWRAGEPECADHIDPTLEMAATIALTHHEKWDGTGYPQKLAGDQIPFESRIVAISDVFDALTSRRPYRAPCSEDQALATVRDGAGRHFDPDVYAAFLGALPEIRALKERFADQVKVSPDCEDQRT